MPRKHKPDRPGLKEISLKELELDHKERKAQWYALNHRSPRVGRPVEQVGRPEVEAAINALMPVFERLQRLRARRPDTQYPLISQGRLRKLVIRRLKQKMLPSRRIIEQSEMPAKRCGWCEEVRK